LALRLQTKRLFSHGCSKGQGFYSLALLQDCLAAASAAAEQQDDDQKAAVVSVSASTVVASETTETAVPTEAHQNDDPKDTATGRATAEAVHQAAAASAAIFLSAPTPVITSTICSS
jgi:hypothetical protein